jgi:hypothetical protein
MEWSQLIQMNNHHYATLFEKPSMNNYSIGLTKTGFYSVADKKFSSSGTASYHWAGDYKGQQQTYIVITETGMSSRIKRS